MSLPPAHVPLDQVPVKPEAGVTPSGQPTPEEGGSPSSLKSLPPPPPGAAQATKEEVDDDVGEGIPSKEGRDNSVSSGLKEEEDASTLMASQPSELSKDNSPQGGLAPVSAGQQLDTASGGEAGQTHGTEPAQADGGTSYVCMTNKQWLHLLSR